MSSDAEAVPLTRRAAREQRTRQKRGWLYFVRDVAVILVIALVVSFLVKTFVVRSFFIPSPSMENTLLVEDRILVDELTPRFTGYERGDIVVFRDPGGWLPASMPGPSKGPIGDGVEWVLSLVGLSAPDSNDHLIKRVIGLPGDHVVCCNPLGQITVNDVPINETSYVRLDPGVKEPFRREYDVVVPEGMLWVLGDNRDHSADSRFNMDGPTSGFVPLDNVVGRAFLRTWPMDRLGGLGDVSGAFVSVPDPEKK